uniref:Protein kinase domain-containing protein n=1 Tax=Arcella intermedia TaxID=1963864 RepID=A0A6B2LGR1_9EUKA|eukprot:TRINITY_DN23608_c0_g1_i1.p1 TRINITY_DN23608_c0_g1~~TRINITY_DN23608_c0_g1_i1.p1  ORF type:complete len:236 (+),score=56.74 TRINITY_DN23608_c0_g1_i1:2-709(+)
MEYMENGSLNQLLSYVQLDLGMIKRIANDISLGMNYLHEEKVLHRDLTSRNILLSEHLQAKVADFGLSRRYIEDNDLSYTMGSIAWMAPEVIADAKSFCKKSDVYSFGVVCWELFSRVSPCPPDLSNINLANKVLNEEWRPMIPESVPLEWKSLIKECWYQKLEVRPSFSQILQILDSFQVPQTTFDSYQYGMVRRNSSLSSEDIEKSLASHCLASQPVLNNRAASSGDLVNIHA